mmetsp:Transcript_2794/g.9416  ORF Transcript_2794/g.9416 Transcript_2794/m.9416 type:complete len:221 (+) Transcript_2794:801-1463(+)
MATPKRPRYHRRPAPSNSATRCWRSEAERKPTWMWPICRWSSRPRMKRTASRSERRSIHMFMISTAACMVTARYRSHGGWRNRSQAGVFSLCRPPKPRTRRCAKGNRRLCGSCVPASSSAASRMLLKSSGMTRLLSEKQLERRLCTEESIEETKGGSCCSSAAPVSRRLPALRSRPAEEGSASEGASGSESSICRSLLGAVTARDQPLISERKGGGPGAA